MKHTMGPIAEILLNNSGEKKNTKEKQNQRSPVRRDLSFNKHKAEGEMSETSSQISLGVCELVLVRKEKCWHATV